MKYNNLYDNLIDIAYKQIDILTSQQNESNSRETSDRILNCVRQIAILNNDKRNHSTPKKWKKANK